MLWLALTTMEKIQQVPPRIWLNIIVGILIFVAVVLLLKRAAGMNKIVLTMIVMVAIIVVGFQWVYERNEPKFLTPTIEKIAPYFPSRVNYSNKQK